MLIPHKCRLMLKWRISEVPSCSFFLLQEKSKQLERLISSLFLEAFIKNYSCIYHLHETSIFSSNKSPDRKWIRNTIPPESYRYQIVHRWLNFSIRMVNPFFVALWNFRMEKESKCRKSIFRWMEYCK